MKWVVIMVRVIVVTIYTYKNQSLVLILIDIIDWLKIKIFYIVFRFQISPKKISIMSHLPNYVSNNIYTRPFDLKFNMFFNFHILKSVSIPDYHKLHMSICGVAILHQKYICRVDYCWTFYTFRSIISISGIWGNRASFTRSVIKNWCLE